MVLITLSPIVRSATSAIDFGKVANSVQRRKDHSEAEVRPQALDPAINVGLPTFYSIPARGLAWQAWVRGPRGSDMRSDISSA
jgi:hypothetical protein